MHFLFKEKICKLCIVLCLTYLQAFLQIIILLTIFVCTHLTFKKLKIHFFVIKVYRFNLNFKSWWGDYVRDSDCHKLMPNDFVFLLTIDFFSLSSIESTMLVMYSETKLGVLVWRIVKQTTFWAPINDQANCNLLDHLLALKTLFFIIMLVMILVKFIWNFYINSSSILMKRTILNDQKWLSRNVCHWRML